MQWTVWKIMNEFSNQPILYLTSGDSSPVQQCSRSQMLGPSPASPSC